MSSPAVAVQNLHHEYSHGRWQSQKRVALHDLSFQVAGGQIFGLLGPNGGGKSTLLRILSTVMRPTSGAASIFGADVAMEAAAVRRKIGVIFQNPSLDKKLTVWENIQIQSRLYGLSSEECRARGEELMARLKIADRRDEFCESLSGGLRRRVEIAKGLIHKPQLLLMDEPSTGLDPLARRDMWRALREFQGQGVTILLTTHLMDEAEACDRLAIVSGGRWVAEGTPAELKARVGGDVMTIQSENAAALAEKIESRWNLPATVTDGQLRIEKDQVHAILPELMEAFRSDIRSVTVGRPTLEDVFIHETGRRFEDEPLNGVEEKS